MVRGEVVLQLNLMCAGHRMKNIYLICILFMFSSGAWSAKDAWPEVPMPRGAEVIIVAEHMVFNGIAMKNWEINSFGKLDKVLSYYQKKWKKPSVSGQPGFVQDESGGWTIISRYQGDYLITVQLMQETKARVHGLVGISKLSGVEKDYELGEGFPFPRDTNVINDIKARDGNKNSRTLIALNSRGVKANAQFFRSRFKRKGWSEFSSKSRKDTMEKAVLVMDRFGDELNMTISATENGSSIVVVLVDN